MRFFVCASAKDSDTVSMSCSCNVATCSPTRVMHRLQYAELYTFESSQSESAFKNTQLELTGMLNRSNESGRKSGGGSNNEWVCKWFWLLCFWDKKYNLLLVYTPALASRCAHVLKQPALRLPVPTNAQEILYQP